MKSKLAILSAFVALLISFSGFGQNSTSSFSASIIFSVNVNCYGLSDGRAYVKAKGGSLPYTYKWTPSGGTQATATGLAAMATYTVTVTDALSNTIIDSVTITQPPLLTATITGHTDDICYGGGTGTANVIAAGGTTPYNYRWYPSGASSATATSLFSGTYTVIVTDSNGCNATASVTITQPTAVSVNASGPASVNCIGDFVSLCATASGGTGAYKYMWQPTGGNSSCAYDNPTVSTTYTVTATDSCGVNASTTITVLVPPPIYLNISGVSSVCPGGSATLCAYPTSGTPPFTYSWFPAGTSQCITVNPMVTTSYSVTLIDANWCNSTPGYKTVYVNPVENVSFTADLRSGCEPLCIQFRDLSTISSGHISQWHWNFGNGDSTNLKSPMYCYWDSGAYSVTLTEVSDSGCSSSLKVINMINVYGPPKADFTLSPQPTTILTPTITFTDKSTDGYGLVYWYWEFGDGGKDTIQNPVHTYNNTGTYCATMVEMDLHGCVDSVVQCLTIDPSTEYIHMTPTAGDGNITLNWFVNNTGAQTLNISIVNELGQFIYSGQLQSQLGSNTEQLDMRSLSAGVYFMRLQNKDIKEEKKFMIIHK